MVESISHNSYSPPLLQHYTKLLQKHSDAERSPVGVAFVVDKGENLELPLIDLSGLNSESEWERQSCATSICRASSEWGFFQVINHGISPDLLLAMRNEQVKLFQTPFNKKASSGILNNSYRWGNPTASSPNHFSWSEAFHIPLTKISDAASYGDGEFSSLRTVMVEFAAAMSKLARLIAGILAENLGSKREVFDEMCDETTCFLRLNRYPDCPTESRIYGLVPHTDSDFLTILYQDHHVGGLQLLKDSKWVDVKPNQHALIVNIGDLLQAWSNDVYKSVEHRVMANKNEERYSIAYFLCPSYESVIGSCTETSIYRKFTFGEYRSQVQEDVKQIGHKVGLPRFRL